MLSIKNVLLLSSICFVNSDVPRPRGVPLSKAVLYSPDKDFSCFDGSLTIPFTFVNDDYCDCSDGSDEPGTSACVNGVFHCSNAGHVAINISSSRVNDGICDCCDGTDEYLYKDSCRNTCEELGKEARLEAERMADLFRQGSQIRQEMIQKGKQKKVELSERIAQLQKDKQDAQAIVSEKELLKNDAESKENDALKTYRAAEEEARARAAKKEEELNKDEARENFDRFDSNQDGILSLDELRTRITFDKNGDGEVSDEEARYYLMENEKVNFEEFFENCWNLVKSQILLERGLFKAPATEEHDGEQDTDAEHIPEEEYEGEDVSEEPEDQHHEEEQHEEAIHYDEQTQALIDIATDARTQHTEAERKLREIENELKSIKESLERDYGTHNEYATLDGQCLEYDEKEYVYKVCLFGKVTQKSKNGGGEVGLGTWHEWAGPDSNKYQAMKYTDGVSCWNGPNRSTLVKLICGLENKLNWVTEPSRCEYVAELSTPAACDQSLHQHSEHDEL